jgi:glycosyltransferase involved in cell wall biosynthesis
VAEHTIITPVLNGAQHIEQCIFSVASQDADVQHIVIDGGSTDGTQDILAKHEKHLFYWESVADNGQSEAINKGLSLAKGRVFNWLNADDLFCDGALKEVSRLMTEDVQTVLGNCAHVDMNGATIAVGRTALYPTLEQTLGRYGMAQPSHFYRMDVIHGLGKLNTTLHYAMDMELWFRYLLRHGLGSVVTTDMTLSNFMVRTDAKSQRMASEMEREKLGIFRTLLSAYDHSDGMKDYIDGLPVLESVDLVDKMELDASMLAGHICCPMLPQQYALGNLDATATLLASVANAGLLSAWDRFLWELRLLKLRITA